MLATLERWHQYLVDGGFVMPFLVATAVLLWFSLGYRWMTLRRGRFSGLRDLVERCGQGQRPVRDGLVCEAAQRGVEAASAAPRDLRAALDVALHPQVEQLSRFRTLARAMVMVAPLAGLLGTVSGMMETFGALGDMTLFSQSGGIAGGIAEALISTQMGLSVAIPGLLIGRLLERREHNLGAEIEQIKEILCGDAARRPAAGEV